MDSPICRDRTKLEHVGNIARVIWEDKEQPVAILGLTDGHAVIINEDADSFTTGQTYRFLGRWEEGKRGPQFKASTWVTETPASSRGITKYLTDHCGGIGNKTAGKLIDAYGSDAVKVLREDPSRVAADGILSADVAKQAAEELAWFAGLERTRLDLFGLIAGRGFPGKLIERALSLWGAKAPRVIKANPFRLMVNRLPGCGWKRCDKLYLELGGNPNSLKRQFLAGFNALQGDRSGSTWLDADVVVSAIREALPGPSCDPIKALKLGIRVGWLRVRRDGSQRWLAIRQHAQAEQQVADSIARLQTATACWPTELPESEAEGDGLPSGHQCDAVRLAGLKPVGCLIGGPGSGKTHTLSFMLRQLIATHGESSVAVAAPTNKAAVRATELLKARGIDIVATSIHKLLEVGRAGKDGSGWGFQRNADNPLAYRFVIIDEASMIDTTLMSNLLEACAVGTHVLFVGDTFQLSPVGHGAPLRDMILSGSVGVGELTEIRRNAGAIVKACSAIKAGLPVADCSRLDLAASDPANLQILDTPIEDVLDWVEDLLRGMSKFDAVWDCQVITALNEKSEVSRKAVNERLSKILNPDGRRVSGCPFAVNDKVICLANSKLRAVVPIGQFRVPEMSEDASNYQTSNTKETEFVANGEQGRVLAVGRKECVMSFGGSKLVAVPIGKAKRNDDEDSEAKASTGAMGDFDLAYGLTVHKSQGSEWPVVIGLMDPAGGSVADRSFWYTAISRAKTVCILIGDRKAFVAQCARQALAKRKTFLVELLCSVS